MGRDKASLAPPSLDGPTLAERAAGVLARVCPEVVAADGGRGVLPGVRSVADAPSPGSGTGSGRGPAAGILGAARAFPGRPLLVLACDVPAVPAELLARLAERVAEGRADLALPRTPGGPEPLVACYGPAALAALAEQVAAGEHAVRRISDRKGLRIDWLEGVELESFGDPERMLANVNTPDDLERLRL